jgi:hypothetical protein
MLLQKYLERRLYSVYRLLPAQRMFQINALFLVLEKTLECKTHLYHLNYEMNELHF